MRKIYIILVLLFFPVVGVLAQMSESEIISYVEEKAAQGMDKTAIVSELVSRGVSIQEIQSLYGKYSNLSYGQSGSVEDSNIDKFRMRDANVESAPFEFPSAPFVTDPKKDAKEIFGHRMFRASLLTFEPNMNIPTPEDYVLGAGDEVIIDIYGASQFSAGYTVSPDGFITVKDAGPIRIAGMTVLKAQTEVRKRLESIYKESGIRLSIGRTRTVAVNILGEVDRPGTYTISAFSNVYNVLYLSGGINEIGTLRNIEISRAGRTISNIDVYDFILNGSLQGSVILKDNDVIRVGTYCNLVKMEGRVRRPMWYELKQGETLENVLGYAGGLTGDAYRGTVRIERKCPDGLKVFNVEEQKFGAFQMADGDVVYVEDAVNRYRNTVTVEGAVFRPGKYQLGDDVKTTKDLVRLAGGLIEKALPSQSALYRMREDRTTEALSIDVAQDEIELRNEDHLVIASNEERDSLRRVTILGEIYRPGDYPYSYEESVRNLIIRAGGLKESASNSHIEVSRRVNGLEDDTEGKVLAKVFDISLDGDGEGFRLEPYDIVAVHRSPDYKEQQTVSIEGEVRYSGRYTLSSKEERVSDIITRAGGLTANAYLDGAQLTRLISEKQRRLMQLEMDISNNGRDSLRIVGSMKDTTYMVGIDLADILKKPGCSRDVVLHAGDVITIPRIDNTVRISGGVLFPNTVAFEDGKNVSYYLNQAGGVTKDGRRSSAYIVYANGQVSRSSEGRVMPGCEIVVPEREKKQINPQNASLWLGLASTMASICAVIASVLK